MFWGQRQIEIRDMLIDSIPGILRFHLWSINKSWDFQRVETPVLMPKSLLSNNYADEDIWVSHDGLCLRPETTPGSYIHAKHLLNTIKPPLCVWQAGKSFRREQHDKSYVHMSLDEFWQMEFQLIYSESTKFDYMAEICDFLPKMMAKILCWYRLQDISSSMNIIESDRLPSYSEKTMDLEIHNGHKMLEVCSISQRTDFNHNNLKVLEIAFGLDRLVSLVNED
jgi:glycyl-tRNA synthetase